jgi:hypothetical protein
MSNEHNRTETGSTPAVERSSRRAEAQEHDDPSGHNMQVTPGQQLLVAESTDRPPRGNGAVAQVDEETLDELRNPDRSDAESDDET